MRIKDVRIILFCLVSFLEVLINVKRKVRGDLFCNVEFYIMEFVIEEIGILFFIEVVNVNVEIEDER